jgi:hypothetical protein
VPGNESQVKGPEPGVSYLELVRLSDVSPAPVKWLWPGRIPCGKITLAAGDPGLGKSLATIDWAARITLNATWPDDVHTPIDGGSVIFLTSEDDAADTVRPRLEAAGGDPSKVHLLKSVALYDANAKRTTREFFSLARDLPPLEKAIADMGDCRMVVIDPVGAYLDGIDAHKNSEVRRVLGPLADLLGKTGVAGVLVDHFNKSSQGKAIYRSMGSIAFTAAARAVWGFARDKDNPARRLMVCVKNNLASDQAGGLAYTIVDVGGVPVLAWERGAVDVSADEVLAPPEPKRDAAELNEAKGWLEQLLNDGPMEAKEVQAQARRDGLKLATVRRAQNVLKIEPYKRGFGPGSAWMWSLPA